MKRILSILIFSLVAFTLTAQKTVQSTKTLSKNVYDSDYAYYEFPMTSQDYITGYVNASGLTYTVTLNKDVPSNVIWYLEMDSVKSSSGTDSINVDIKLNYKHFSQQSAYTTAKTIAVDLDNAGDYKALVADSSYIMPTNFTAGGDNVYLGKPDFANIYQLSITPTSGAGVGKLNDRVTIKKVVCRVKLR